MNTLTEQEQKFLSLLGTLNNDSYWGLGIGTVVNNPEPDRVRRLIRELKEQAGDSPEIMKKIIGKPGLKQLQNL